MPDPVIILVRPQLSENIGTTARAMLNCGLTDLRLVAPREDWLGSRAFAAASGADRVLLGATVFESTADAVGDLQRVWATTARSRFMTKPMDTPKSAAAAMRAIAAEQSMGVLFGPERTGLENDDLVLADTVLTVPVNPDYASLNLAQCVLLVAYEWFQAGLDATPPAKMTRGAEAPASKDKLIGFFDHLERELDECGFLRVAEKRPTMVRNIRNMFQRAGLTGQEIQTLHGIVHELVTYRHKKATRQ